MLSCSWESNPDLYYSVMRLFAIPTAKFFCMLFNQQLFRKYLFAEFLPSAPSMHRIDVEQYTIWTV